MNQPPYGGLSNGFEQLSLDERSATGILQHLQKDELQSLMDDDSKLEQLIQDLDMVKQLKNTKETLMVSNKSVAEYNLSKEDKLIQSRNLLAETYGRVENLLQCLRKKKIQLESHGNQTSLDTLLALLETEAAKSEEQSEELSEQLLSNKMDIGKFVDTYLVTRSLMYQQKVKAEKMSEVIYRQT